MEPDAHSRDPVAVVSARALGDGLLALLLVANLQRAGREAILYHTQLVELRDWFPAARIQALPEGQALRELLRSAPALFLGDPALGSVPLPPTDDRREQHVFSKDTWTRSRSVADNLARVAAATFSVRHWTPAIGLVPPAALSETRYPRRVCLHPTSAKANKNWPAEHFLALADRLANEGYEPVFLLAADTEAAWLASAGSACEVVVPGTLDRVAAYLHTSGAVIATDSGIGHLAAAVGTPTLSLFRKRSAARFWRPPGAHAQVVTAALRLPGKSGHRHWGRLLTPSRVQRAFQRLMRTAP